MRIAFYGGTFDPVHIQHVQIARFVIQQDYAQRLVFLPAPNPPHKDAERQVSAYRHRRTMLDLALRNDPELEVSDFETERPGKSYTLETMRLLSRKYPQDQIFWLIGADSLRTLHTWYHAAELVDQFHFLIYPRPGEPISETELAERWSPSQIKRLMEGVLTDAPVLDAASSVIRMELSSGNGNPMKYLDPEVFNYVRTHQLYKTTPQTGV